MDDAIQLISDGDGLAIIGGSAAVEELLLAEGLWSSSRDLGQRLGSVLGVGTAVAVAGSEIAAHSGRWVKLTEESAQLVKRFGLMDSKTPGISHAMVGEPGSIKSWLQIAKGSRAFLNAGMLAGVAGLMQQAAMQQSMAEITAYLARIDEKIDELMRKVDDTVRKDMIGAGAMIARAMTMREEVGWVTDDSWSTVQDIPGKLADVQGYALLQIEAITAKLEDKNKMGGLAQTAREAEREVQGWLTLLAHCFQMQDAFDVLELDRALDASREELEARLRGVKTDRQNRLEIIARTLESLLVRMDAAVSTANAKVLLHRTASRAVVDSGNHVAAGIHEFFGLLGIAAGLQSWHARRWKDAAAEARDKVLEKAGPAAAGIAVGGIAIALKVLHDRDRKG
ncbi:hypothetical protein Val02_62600 [Virgisporangium aliadipatigenens]|uniref:Uncharacterized protein n=1 Tax=Virgisporangium aliadipatigenens TaxID=741659 RepID=A0A8J4DT33_9ACTN|nr:hypothetical protein [Virgisporangium aliadipatigenens]GIJ49374.1 hypothetical protein Val02_62600 [Virgisporangium aliadipatigenens]